MKPKPITLVSGSADDFQADPQPFAVIGEGIIDPQPAIANITTADATDAATAVTLANATKAKVNAILGALRNAGVIAS